MGALAGRVALVTGGSRGIGLEVARAFVREGAKVAVCGRDPASVDAAAKELGVLGVRCDVSRPKEVEPAIAAVEAKLGPIDVLVNNAAVFLDRGQPIWEVSLGDFDDTLAANLCGPFIVTRRVLPGMIARGYGRVVNVTSGLATGRMAGYGAYSVSKAALEGFTRVLATELAGRGDVLVNALDPGVARTGMNPTADLPPTAPVPAILHLATLPAGAPTGAVWKKDLSHHG
jgi:NAD(P)-dependent dehydrogenase (short-subunit alcohol dehydrogenase family)